MLTPLGDQHLRDVGHRVAAVGEEQRIGRAARLGHVARRTAMRLCRRIVLERDDVAAAACNLLLERRFHHIAIGIVGNQRGEGALPDAGGILHDARYVGFRQEAQQIDAARRHVGVGREGDDRNIARARDLPDDADRLRKQRAENDLGAFVERLLRRQLGAFGLPPSSFTRS